MFLPAITNVNICDDGRNTVKGSIACARQTDGNIYSERWRIQKLRFVKKPVVVKLLAVKEN
jgi:hypothetical protein